MATDEPDRFERLVQSITDYAIYMLDLDGVITSWNAGAERYKGYSADEIIGRNFSRFYTDADRSRGLPKIALATAAREGRFEAEGWRVRKDGSEFWANVVIDPIRDSSGTLIGFAKVTRDLTDRKMAEEALRRSEERFRMLVESVTDYAIYMLHPDGEIASWNAGAERVKGYMAEEIVGQNFSRFYIPEDRDARKPARALETAAREGEFKAEGWRVRKDGTRFWANVVIDPIRDSTGTLIGFAKVTRDLTERQKSQRALELAQESLFQSQKMDAIGKLTGGVAHDFNNLLAAVIGSLELAQRRLAKGGDVSRYIENAMKAAERGATLTQRMLAFARKQDLEFETIDPIRLMHGMADLMQRTLGAQVTIETRFPVTLKSVHADAGQLELAILNLAVNARDAIGGHGEIVITASEQRVDKDNEQGLPPGSFVCISVLDSGEGMDAETMAKAMEPFFTTKGIGKGTGLGLSMVHGFAEQSGGRLTLRSTKGKGTTASLWLPVSSAPARAEVQKPLVDESRSRPLTILVVDDDALVLINTAGMLEELGHTVIAAESGAEALLLLTQHPIDVILTDFAMPHMNGVELAEAAKAQRPEIPTIIVTGYAEFPQALTGKFNPLRKPFKQHQLSRSLHELAEKQRAN